MLQPLRNKTVIATLCALILSFAGTGPTLVEAAPLEESAREGYRAPRFQLPDLDGTRHTLRQYRGQVILLNFWASWCAPCITEMPDLQEIHEIFADEPFTVLAISEDTRIEHAQRFVAGKEFEFPLLHDTDQDVSKDYMVRGLPATFLLDAEGVVIQRISGPREWASEEWQARIRELLPDKTKGAEADRGSEEN